MLETISHERILELRLARPPANALDPELIGRLLAEVRSAPEAGAEAVVLSGAPGMFSAGLDVPFLLTQGRETIRATWGRYIELLKALGRSPVPVAAAVTGHSPAGGAVMAIFCDYRVMAEGDFKIGLNEVQVGIPLWPAVPNVLKLLVGHRQAGLLAPAGRMVDSATAAGIGLVDRLAPVDEVVERALAWCRGLLALPRHAMLTTRASCRSELHAICDTLREEDADQLVEAWFSEETQGALRAMVERVKGKKG